MKHTKALSIKFLFTTSIIILFLAFFDSSTLSQMIMTSLIITGITYVTVDILLLPVLGKLAAAMVDFGLLFLSVWLLSGIFLGQTTTLVLTSLFIAYVLTACESIFHIYMKKRVLPRRLATIIPFPTMKLQAEISKEIYPDKDDKKSNTQY
ncbi:YndM family protein [Oceanobacillus luteolus]|uniref:YndM family protein n=1 Tax=Oceanobacillus luteolus TaxID=1274358 RepID=UPI00203CC20E|nr:YndM family protein [Oceanobacillus luteolus]MCM3742323.1 YndM family protein [Oceanobacillus luteolus]